MSTNLANNLKYLRTLHNYSQDELAKQLYVSHQTISNHETGKSQPDLDTIHAYAKFYDVNFQDLIHIDLSKHNHRTKIIFDEVIFDKRDKTMIILNGTKGTYDYRNCIACKILNEDARYKGKEKPFTHTFIDRKIQSRILFEPTFYIGLKIILKDKTELAIYTSKEKTYSGTDQYRSDHAKAEEIKKFIDKIIKTYNN